MTHDFYRPMHWAMERASLEASGEVVAVRVKSELDSDHASMHRAQHAYAGGPGGHARGKKFAEGRFHQAYAFPSQKMERVATRMGVPVGYWRYVGHSHNAFVIEFFIDELASHRGQYPVEFGRCWLRGAPGTGSSRADWGGKLTPGHARSIALHESFGTIVG